MRYLEIAILVILSTIGAKAQTLHLYGGDNHDTYLGCLNCSSFNSSSIWNEFGSYGSSFNSNSIWNEFGTYGSKFSSYSPWNAYSSSPPAIVDRDGNFYGYLTVNRFHANRAEFDLVLELYKYHDLIREDVGKWYDKLFD